MFLLCLPMFLLGSLCGLATLPCSPFTRTWCYALWKIMMLSFVKNPDSLFLFFLTVTIVEPTHKELQPHLWYPVIINMKHEHACLHILCQTHCAEQDTIVTMAIITLEMFDLHNPVNQITLCVCNSLKLHLETSEAKLININIVISHSNTKTQGS